MIKQVAALPYRLDPEGNVEVMLITSKSDGQHWMPPKGNLIADLRPYETAAREAYEEAGVIGSVSPRPLGKYAGVKSRSNGETARISVTLYALHVVRRESDWPEKGRRSAGWFELSGAARVVREPDLARLLERFQQPAAQRH